MNICFFSQEYPPETHVGGIATYTYNMAGALAKLGHTVHVITSTQDSGQIYKDNGVWVHRIHNRPFRPIELSQLKYSYSVARKIIDINCTFDIVQSSEFAGEALWYSYTKKYPVVTRLATPFFQLRRLNGRFFCGIRPITNFMEKKQTLRSDGIFTSTRALAQTVTDEWRIDRSRVDVIPNSVDISRVIKLGTSKPIPDTLKGIDYLLYFGRLEERKGVHVLANSLPVVFEKIPNISCVFAGSDYKYQDCSMRDYIRKKCSNYLDRLIFFDNLPQDELFPVVNAARIVILPSLWEAFGFVCVEAMALGRPVIASSGSGFSEIIEDGISGYLVEPGKSGVLAEKIIHALNDEEGLKGISEGATNRAQDFEVSKIALKLISYYEKIIESRLEKCGNQ